MKDQELMLHKGSYNVNNIEITKDYIVDCLKSQGLNLQPNQEKQFIDICRAYQLNPVKKEIYAIAYGKSFNIIVGYEVYLKRAERTGKLDGWNVVTSGSFTREKRIKKTNYGDKEYQYPVSNDGFKAIITIYRNDRKHPFIHEVYLEEYCDMTDIWCNKTYTMLKKVATAQGFKMCFPDELGGLPYTEEETSSFIDIDTGDKKSKVTDDFPYISESQQLINTMKDFGIESNENMKSFADFHKINSKESETFRYILQDFESYFDDWQKFILEDK